MADEVEDTKAEDVEDTDDETEDEGTGDEAASPEEIARMRRALKRYATENKRTKAKLADVMKSKDETKPEDIKAAARAEAEAAYKPLIVREAAKTAFLEAGLVLPKGKEKAAVARVVKLLDLKSVEVDEDGDVEGLEDQIADIKDEFPELFVAAGRRRGNGGGVDASASNPVKKNKTIGDLHAAKLGLI